MKPPKIPANETARLAALRDLSILDTAAEERFDRLTRLAQHVFQMPIALISLVDAERQWFKSRQGLDACETPRDVSFCGHAILSDDVFHVPNALEDERFADNPLVTGAPHIRFYAGYPLATPEGHRIGTLCIIDNKPRQLSEQDFQALRDLGKCVEDELNQARLQRVANTFYDQETYLRAVLDSVKDGIISIDSHGIIQTINPSTSELFGYKPEELLGHDVGMIMPEDIAREHTRYLENYINSAKDKAIGFARELVAQHKDGSTFPIELDIRMMQQHTGESHFVSVVRDISARRQAEHETHIYTRALEKLHDITADVKLDLGGRIQAILALGREIFDLPMGIVSHIVEDAYTVEYCATDDHALAPGTVFSLSDTYCQETLKADRPIGFNDIENSILAKHPCYKKFALKTYLGTPLYVGSTLHGTLNFCSNAARQHPFTPRHYSLIRLFAQWVGNMLEEERIKGELYNVTRLRQAILDSANFSIISVDAHGVIKSFNKGAQRMLGYTEAEVVNKMTPEVLHDNVEVLNRAKVLSRELGRPIAPGFEVFIARTRLGLADEHEWTYIRKDGSRFPVLLSVTALHDKDNIVTGFLGIASDITERKRANEALLASEQKLSSLYRLSPVAISLNRMSDGKFIEGNPQLYRMTGYSEQEFTQLTYWDLTPEEYTKQEEWQLESLRARGTYGPYEKEFIHKDGHRFPVLLNGTLITSESGEPQIWSIVQDISERVRTERELQERERYTRAIIDNVVDAIITINTDGNIESFNNAAEEIFGYQAQDVIGRNISLLMPEPHNSRHDHYLVNYLKTNQGNLIRTRREFEGVHRDGSHIPIELSISDITYGGERKFVGVVRDITERKRIDRIKNEFISTVSHELRTPLTSIKGALSLVLTKAAHELSPKIVNMLQTASRNSERLSLLINDILDLEKIESGKMQFEFNVADLVSITRSALVANESYAQQHAVHLHFETDETEAPIIADEHRLQQVFANLLSNAIKFSPPECEVLVELRKRNKSYRVSVKDSGRGIPPEFHSRIFQRFAQADSSDTREKGGTGLGLSITKAIVERHGGSIGFNSVEGAGAEFFFDLPDTMQTFESKDSHQDKKVLIYQEDGKQSTIRARLLEREGIKCDIAATAEDARNRIDTTQYQALMIDLKVDDHGGIQLLQELHKQQQDGQNPLILVACPIDETGATAAEDTNRFSEQLQRPVIQTHLETVLRALVADIPSPRILHYVENPEIAMSMQSLVAKVGEYILTPNSYEARRKLRNEKFDLIILNPTLPDASIIMFMHELHRHVPVLWFPTQVLGSSVLMRIAAVLGEIQTARHAGGTAVSNAATN